MYFGGYLLVYNMRIHEKEVKKRSSCIFSILSPLAINTFYYFTAVCILVGTTPLNKFLRRKMALRARGVFSSYTKLV